MKPHNARLEDGRVPMTAIDWFRKSGCLAIADIAWVKGIGLCSHQPRRGGSGEFHRMMEADGTIHYVETTRLLSCSPEEHAQYWQEFAG